MTPGWPNIRRKLHLNDLPIFALVGRLARPRLEEGIGVFPARRRALGGAREAVAIGVAVSWVLADLRGMAERESV
jgi:hypothetical protein